MQELQVFVGVDVAKAELVIARHGQTACLTIPNEAQSISTWLRELPPGACVAMESTGRYHQMLASLAHAAGLQVFVLNARDVHFYAKALGARAKTDRVDAHVIARYAAEQHTRLQRWIPPCPALAQVQSLLGQRWAVVSKRTALRQSLRGCDGAITLEFQALEAGFAALLKAIDARIVALLAQDARVQERQRLLQSIVGVGHQSSALLASLLSRVNFVSADALVAYSGLDPRACDSGSSRGRRRLSKRGQPALRHQMFMAAMSACHTSTFKSLYQALRARGLKTTEALVVLARKLLRIAFAIWRSGKPFDPQRFAPAA
jgi:transposase